MSNGDDGIASAAKSALHLWIFLALLSSFVSLFGNAAFEVKIFQIFVGLYRTITFIFYNAVDWPERFGLPFAKTVRDLTTLLIVSAVVTALKARSEAKALNAYETALWSPADPATVEPSLDVGQISSVASGAFTGLLIGGPIGLLVGALGSGLLGLAKTSEPQPATPSLGWTGDQIEAWVEDEKAESRKRVAGRFLLCVIVGIGIILLDASSSYLIEVLSEIDSALQQKAEDFASVLAVSS